MLEVDTVKKYVWLNFHNIFSLLIYFLYIHISIPKAAENTPN